ncbi:MAG: SBBP repeat-containing protein [Candidatus Aminicenantaceae bacterium]
MIGHKGGTIRKAGLFSALLLLGAVFVPPTFQPATSTALRGSLPLAFVENLGQLDSRVEFHLNTPQGQAYYLQDAIVYQLVAEQSGHNIRLEFLESSPEVKIEGVERSPTRMNFYHGKNPDRWVTGARTFGGLEYKSLYPEIDLLICRQENLIKHEYRIRPGGNIETIAVRYHGVEKLAVNSAGELDIISGGQILFKEAAPVSYQIIEGRKKNVETWYSLQEENVLRFEAGPYQRDKELIIDPSLIFSTYLGGKGLDSGNDIAVDLGLNTYVVGSTKAADFPSQSGMFSSELMYTQAFLTKLDPTGSQILFSTVFGGWNDDVGLGIAVSWIDDSVVITGETDSYDFPTTQGVYDETHNGGFDIFLAKFDFSGTLIFSTYLGEANQEFDPDVALDGAGSIYVAGQTRSPLFPTTPDAFDREYDEQPYDWTMRYDDDNIFVAKFDPLGSKLLYSTFYGKYMLRLGGIAVDFDGNAFITGGIDNYCGTIPVTPGVYGPDCNVRDGFLARIDPTGSRLVFSTHLGDTGYELWDYDIYVQGIDVDGIGRAAITGDYVVEGMPARKIWSFTMVFTADGKKKLFEHVRKIPDQIWEKETWGRDVAFDGRGGLYVLYETTNPDLNTTEDAVQGYMGGESDIYIEKMKAFTGEIIYATYLGGNDYDRPRGLVVDSFGSAYVTGVTESVDFPTTPQVLSPSPIGQGDAFVVRIRDGGPKGKLKTNRTEMRFQSPYESTDTKTKRFTIRNTGAGVVSYAVSANQSWIRLSRQSGEVRYDTDDLLVTVDPWDLKSGVHLGTVKITSSDAFNSPVQIPVRYMILGPVLELSKNGFLFEAAAGGFNPASQECRLRNKRGPSRLTYHISSQSSWLSTSRSRGVSHGEWDKIMLRVDVSGLEAGIHQGTIQVAADETVEAPKVILVILNLKTQE